MANTPLRRKVELVEKPKPKIWATGAQRPPFHFGALGRASLYLSREAVAPMHAWAARTARRVAVNVKNGAGRIPEEKLGRAARFVPSHLRVAAWIKNVAATLSHASATADTDIKRGNALVTEIEPHLWDVEGPAPAASETPPAEAEPTEAEPVVLAEPMQPEDDPLASIREDLDNAPPPPKGRARWKASPSSGLPDGPPAPPGPVATMAIQMIGYVIGWGTAIAALPYGLGRSLWLYYSKYQDLRKIGTDD
ncbi:hypothetical protein [Tabrizicola sp.]|uniref:hypothetical protein n=1 Tax=Tabrizicola sp. TaxID=2005166 RepID=UPI003F2F827A